ncbi:SpoIIE family protein phosphatase, partial [Streptomyces sp. NPDC055144]
MTALVDVLDAAVVRHNAYAAETGDSERFVTALVVEITPDEHVQFANCGHDLPYLVCDGVATALTLSASVPLG